jgi:signal transduction histidine kinase
MPVPFAPPVLRPEVPPEADPSLGRCWLPLEHPMSAATTTHLHHALRIARHMGPRPSQRNQTSEKLDGQRFTITGEYVLSCVGPSRMFRALRSRVPGRVAMNAQEADTNEARRKALAAAIERHQSEIINKWLARVREDAEKAGHEVSLSELRDGIGDYLSSLADALRNSESAEIGGTDAWKRVAKEHALTRVRLGFDIDQLVHEFVVLRQVAQQIAIDPSDGLQIVLLADLIDAAIATSVKSYVESRDYRTRQQEEEHLGFLTHELRNPLTTASLAASQLRKDSGLSPKSQRVLDLLDHGLERTKELIEQALLSGKLEAGQAQAIIEDLRAADLIEEALTAAGAEARRKGLALETIYDREIVVRADSKLIVSAIQNLVDNAVKFTDHGRIAVMLESQGDQAVIHVRDNCPGISAAELERIFEPYERGSSGKPGTGLGLAIARRAITLIGGTIGAESKEKQGCHFWITVPLGASRPNFQGTEGGSRGEGSGDQ